jgi:hypothetical protein
MHRDEYPPFTSFPLPDKYTDIPDPTIPSGKDLDFINPLIYPKCYVNFATMPWEKCIGKE